MTDYRCEGCDDPATEDQDQTPYYVSVGYGMQMNMMWLCQKCLDERRARAREAQARNREKKMNASETPLAKVEDPYEICALECQTQAEAGDDLLREAAEPVLQVFGGTPPHLRVLARVELLAGNEVVDWEPNASGAAMLADARVVRVSCLRPRLEGKVAAYREMAEHLRALGKVKTAKMPEEKTSVSVVGSRTIDAEEARAARSPTPARSTWRSPSSRRRPSATRTAAPPCSQRGAATSRSSSRAC
jgi:hypothetical protein